MVETVTIEAQQQALLERLRTGNPVRVGLGRAVVRGLYPVVCVLRADGLSWPVIAARLSAEGYLSRAGRAHTGDRLREAIERAARAEPARYGPMDGHDDVRTRADAHANPCTVRGGSAQPLIHQIDAEQRALLERLRAADAGRVGLGRAVVRVIYPVVCALRTDGMSWSAIAARLADEGFVSRTGAPHGRHRLREAIERHAAYLGTVPGTAPGAEMASNEMAPRGVSPEDGIPKEPAQRRGGWTPIGSQFPGGRAAGARPLDADAPSVWADATKADEMIAATLALAPERTEPPARVSSGRGFLHKLQNATAGADW